MELSNSEGPQLPLLLTLERILVWAIIIFGGTVIVYTMVGGLWGVLLVWWIGE